MKKSMKHVPIGTHVTNTSFLWHGTIVPQGAFVGHLKYKYNRRGRGIPVEVEFICLDYDPVEFTEMRCHYKILVLNYQTGEFYDCTTRSERFNHIADLIEKYTEENNVTGKVRIDHTCEYDSYIGCPHDRNPRRGYDLELNPEKDYSSRVITDDDAIPHWLDGNTRKDYNIYKSNHKYSKQNDVHVSIAHEHESFYNNPAPVRGKTYPKF